MKLQSLEWKNQYNCLHFGTPCIFDGLLFNGKNDIKFTLAKSSDLPVVIAKVSYMCVALDVWECFRCCMMLAITGVFA